NLGFFLNAGFDQVFNMMNDSVISVVDILDTYVYRIGLLNMQYSFSTAASLFKGAIGLILILGTHLASKRASGKGLW
ncbi:MAG TPA: sugar ABC transporter permease, partial [Spirochaetales bacterium]|nr:sugar ABC transporter permease [Spirochaetales bacterium]